MISIYKTPHKGNFILIFVVAVLFSNCGREKTYLPKEFLQLKLVRKLQGAAAQSYVNRLHFEEVTSRDNQIGFYEGPNGPLTIYVTTYESSDAAKADEIRMTKKISPQNSVFIKGEYIEFENKEIYRCFGMGQTHFVFTHENHLLWMSVNTVKATTILREYLILLN